MIRQTSLALVLFFLSATIDSSFGQFRDGGEGCDATSNFGSFSGKPAKTIADCIWDSFACQGPNPNAVPFRQATCCAVRFDNCCMYVMNPEAFAQSLSDPGIPDEEEETTTLAPTTTTTEKPYQHADTLIGCIWQFNNCVQAKFSAGEPEDICNERVEECKMIIMGMVPANGAAVGAATVPAPTTSPAATPGVGTGTETRFFVGHQGLRTGQPALVYPVRQQQVVRRPVFPVQPQMQLFPYNQQVLRSNQVWAGRPQPYGHQGHFMMVPGIRQINYGK